MNTWARLTSVMMMGAAVSGCVVGDADDKPPIGQVDGLLALVGDEARSIDGAGNNLDHPRWGAAGTPLERRLSAGYADGRASPAGPGRPSARAISTLVVAGPGGQRPAADASDYLWAWGQFIDHDLDLSDAAVPAEAFPVAVPVGDPWFDPDRRGDRTIPLDRSGWVIDGAGIRQQVNSITAFIDASNVYGSDPGRAAALRTFDGTGRLKTGVGDLLPHNLDGLPNAQPAGRPAAGFFLAGDVRANEVVSLLSLHTLFMREHNRVVALIAALVPDLDDEALYQAARRLVGAELQAITYNEFLPRLLGEPLPAYTGYRPEVSPAIANSFSTAGFRLGHSLLSNQILRLDSHGDSIAAGPLALAQAFFAPAEVEATGIEPVLRGLASQRCQPLDTHVVEGVRNFLFGPPGAGGLDLAALNIQRGRDHGLPGYAQARRELGLAPVTSFAQITSDPDVADRLATAYGAVDAIDLWVGALAEDPLPGALVGPTLRAILVDQFTRVRDGDRFWYQRLPTATVDYVETMTLARVIQLNTSIGAELPADVFTVASAERCADGLVSSEIPPLPIPDSDPNGVTSPIVVTGAGTVVTASISLAIGHPYRGDLRVTLVSPRGTRVVVHDRAGGSADDLFLDRVDVGMVGEPAAGTWTLEVVDAAPSDLGALVTWSLRLSTDCAQACVDRTASTSPGRAIPDADPAGVVSSLDLDVPGTATSVELSASIVHPFRGDLRVLLTAPDGTEVVIVDREGGATDDVDLVRQRVTMAAGHRAGGTWSLRVIDAAAQDVGTLRSWSLAVHACTGG
ncbi:MAG: peroxidase family protein [Kofleriaceae bacterium]